MFDPSSYDPALLDSQFNNRQHVPDYAVFLDRWERRSRETERTLPVIRDIAYGDLPREKLDIYPSPQPRAKTLVFIHGGYWQMLDKNLFHFLAGSFRPYGITTVLLTYPLAPDVSIDQIVFSCRRAMQWLHQHVAHYNGDPDQLYLAGHSAGGHLAAMLLTTGAPVAVLKGACLISGLFNLVPVQLSSLNKVLQMDPETAIRNSPLRFGAPATSPLLVAVGEAETKIFVAQSKDLHHCWKGAEKGIRFFALPGHHHYSIVESLGEPGAPLHTALCALMGISAFPSP